MKRLGPLPEQPTFNAQVPWTDLRDAIRMEHGLEPLDPKDVPRYSEPPVFTFEDSQEPPRKRYVEKIPIWTVKNLGYAVLFIGAAVFPFFPTFTATACVILFVLGILFHFIR